MYLLFLDESGTHGNAPVFVLGGVAVHERDAPHLAKRVESNLTYRLAALGLNARDFELHATNLKSGSEEWSSVTGRLRAAILGSTYHSIASYQCMDPKNPVVMFGAVVDHRYGDREERAYDLVLNKFDEMLDWSMRSGAGRHSGLVVHDRRVVDTPLRRRPSSASSRSISAERRIQEWTRDWQEVAGRVGKLHNLADVPFFADSKASRLVQIADFVSWALWRYYGVASRDDRWVRDLWSHFHNSDGNMHGLIHVSPDFARRACSCPPCRSRLAMPVTIGSPSIAALVPPAAAAQPEATREHTGPDGDQSTA